MLARASDGLLYVVKFANNLQGTNLLFNEGMGTELYAAFGLPVPHWKPLEVTNSFIAQNCACWMETPTGFLRPTPGLCFGSRFLGDEGMRLFEILPGSYFSRVENAADFWLAWLLDIAAEHADHRQAIFREERNGWLGAVFIDHGHMFGGPKAEHHGPFGTSRYLDLRIYPHITEPLMVKLSKTRGRLDADGLWRRMQALPDDWKTDSALQSFATCLDRLASARFVESVLDTMAESHGFQAGYGESDLHCGQRPRAPILRAPIPAAGQERNTAA